MNQLDIHVDKVEVLFKNAQLSTRIIALSSCAKGGNNRTYRVETTDGVFAIKKYFRGDADKRDRLTSEFSFLMYAKNGAPDFVPVAYAKDEEDGLALYEFIDGRSLTTNDLTEANIAKAIRFFCALNDPETKRYAKELPLASEAGFSIQDHLVSVDARIRGLEQAILGDVGNVEAKELIVSLSKRWQLLVTECKNAAMINHMDVTSKLNDSQRCISPSDFGFHNALIKADNSVKFLDFEYAGWDDPARMVNDFFSQLAIPIPTKFYDWFVHESMRPFPESELLVQRAKMLRPIYHVKWCCIALNVFIPVNMARRQFANPDLNVIELRKAQLTKAELLLNKLELPNYASY